MLAAVLQDDHHLVGVLHDMVVGDDIAARIDDEARAQRSAGDRRAFAALLFKEAAQEFVERRRRQPAGRCSVLRAAGVGFRFVGSGLARTLNSRHIDHGGHYPLDHGSKARQGASRHARPKELQIGRRTADRRHHETEQDSRGRCRAARGVKDQGKHRRAPQDGSGSRSFEGGADPRVADGTLDDLRKDTGHRRTAVARLGAPIFTG